MANDKAPSGNDAVAADEGVSLPRMKLGAVGIPAIKYASGKIYEEANTHFRYPNMLKVVSEMKYSPPVSIALSAINTLMNRTEVTVKPVSGETETDKVRREFLLSVLHDMEDSWQSTMQSISTYKEYGHQVSEMVFRRRLKRNGSRYDDGLIGLAGLKNRPQNSIAKWNFSEDGRKLVSVSQSLRNIQNPQRFQNITNEEGYIEIPREKFILFRADPVDDNPEGVSILRSAYLAYKQLTLLTDNMMVGVGKDIAGIPYAQIPPQYMSDNASPEDAAVYNAYKSIINDIADGTQRGIILPKMVDTETKQDMFSFSLLEQKAGKSYDLPTIIKMLQASILSVLSCDSIVMGDAGGSLSLQDGDTNLLALQVAYRLSEISNTLNQELVPMLWRLNGWDTARMPTIHFKDVSSVSLEEFSKFIQRIMSVGGLEMDRGVMNKIREVGGFELKPEDEEIDTENLSTTLAGKATSAGEGMAVGVTGDGTSKKPGGQDNSAKNSDNKA